MTASLRSVGQVDPAQAGGVSSSEGMKVAFLVRAFPELSETFVLNQMTGLLDAGVDLDVFAWGAGQDEPEHREVATYGLRRRTHYIRPPKSPLRRVGATVRELLVSGAWKEPGVLMRSVNRRRYGPSARSLFLLHAGAVFLREGPHSVIHCQFGRLGLTAMALQEIGFLTGNIVVSFRGSDISRHQDAEGYDQLFRRARLLLPVCRAFGRRLESMGCDPDKVHVVHSGIRLEGFEVRPRTRPPGDPTRFLTIARLVEKKGIVYALQGMARLRSREIPAELTVVGDGPLRADLERLSAELGLQGQVSFTGAVERREVVALLQWSHVLVAPSVTASTGDQEGIPNVLKEAMATGMPVVSTVHSGIPELVEDGISGFLVPERDPEALARRMEHLARHPETWSDMGRAGRRRVEEAFDSRKVNAQLLTLYEKCGREPVSGSRNSHGSVSDV